MEREAKINVEKNSIVFWLENGGEGDILLLFLGFSDWEQIPPT